LDAAQALLTDLLAELSSVEGVASIQRIVCGGCHDFKVITKLSAAAFGDWEKADFTPEKEFLSKLGGISGVSGVETQTYTLEEVKLNKKDAKKALEKKEADAEKQKADAPKPPEDPAKKLKKVIKEGGKRGVEIEGAADMGGLRFFSTSVDEPDGDLEMLIESMKAMNNQPIPGDEERKGCSGHIGKTIFSAGTEQLSIVSYVPKEEQGNLNCKAWLEAILANFGGELISTSDDICSGRVKADGNKNIFPLKIREPMILEANNFLRKKGLFPEDNSDDDEMVFGDDDFPS